MFLYFVLEQCVLFSKNLLSKYFEIIIFLLNKLILFLIFFFLKNVSKNTQKNVKLIIHITILTYKRVQCVETAVCVCVCVLSLIHIQMCIRDRYHTTPKETVIIIFKIKLTYLDSVSYKIHGHCHSELQGSKICQK